MKKLLIASLVIFGSCKSTETISQFAKSTSTGAAEISRATLGFNQICERYDPASLKNLPIPPFIQSRLMRLCIVRIIKKRTA